MRNQIAGFFIGGWYVFDNFSPLQVQWRKVLYPTSEHAYHAAKFIDSYPNLSNDIRLCKSPVKAASLAAVNKTHMSADWYSSGKAEKMMEEILRAKLNQHNIVKDSLIKSGNMKIIEMNDSDSFWGWGPDHRGDNRLGKIWMKLRSELIS